MNRKINVVEGRGYHVFDVVGNLREADWEEVKAATGKDPDYELIDAWTTSLKRWAILLDDRVIGVFGLSKHPQIPEVGVPWLLGTESMEKIKFYFVRECKKYIQLMLDDHEILINFVDIRNKNSIRWLKWCDFTFLGPIACGPSGLPFYQFFKLRG